MRGSVHPVTKKFIKHITNAPDRTVKMLGCKFLVMKGVFPIDSPFSHSSLTTAKRLKPKNSDTVLDMGTGTGIQAVVAAKRGARKVVAVDIDKKSLICARKNAVINGFASKIEVRKSFLFRQIRKSEKFDLIISQLPFADAYYKSSVSHFLFDWGYRLHNEFLRNARKHLKAGGKIMIPSGTIANEKSLLQLTKKYGYKIAKIDREKTGNLTWKVYTLKYG